MAQCAKFISAQDGAAAYRTRPAGPCSGCVFFSQKNCGGHASELNAAGDAGLQARQVLL